MEPLFVPLQNKKNLGILVLLFRNIYGFAVCLYLFGLEVQLVSKTSLKFRTFLPTPTRSISDLLFLFILIESDSLVFYLYEHTFINFFLTYFSSFTLFWSIFVVGDISVQLLNFFDGFEMHRIKEYCFVVKVVLLLLLLENNIL